MSREDSLKQKAKDAFRVTKTNKLIEAIILIVLGVVLFIWSGPALLTICRVISVIIAVLGVVVIVMYFFGRESVYGSAVGLFFGVVAVALGLYLFTNPDILASLGPIIVGLIILVTGIVDLSEAMRITKQKSGGAVAALVIAVVEIVLGVVFFIHPSILNNIIMKLMAISLIADGIADIWVMFQIGKGEKVVEAVADAVTGTGTVIDGEARPLDEASDAAGEEDAAEEKKGFFARQKEKAEARRKAKEEEKAAQEASEAAGAEDAADAAGTSAAPENAESAAGYTTIPRHHEEAKPADAAVNEAAAPEKPAEDSKADSPSE